MNNSDEISTECDIVIYDSTSTPLIQSSEFQRFYPLETVCAVGEVKSVLSKQKFKEALNKLSQVKRMRENISDPVILKRDFPGNYAPQNNPYDQIFTFLICQKLDFDLNQITTEINQLYERNTPYRYRHNLILSVEDGIILLYYDENYKSFMYPTIGSRQLKNRLRASDENSPFAAFKLFTSYIFMGTSSATILYPDLTNYMGLSVGGLEQNEL